MSTKKDLNLILMSKLLTLVLIIAFAFSCKNSKQNNLSSKDEEIQTSANISPAPIIHHNNNNNEAGWHLHIKKPHIHIKNIVKNVKKAITSSKKVVQGASTIVNKIDTTVNKVPILKKIVAQGFDRLGLPPDTLDKINDKLKLGDKVLEKAQTVINKGDAAKKLSKNIIQLKNALKDVENHPFHALYLSEKVLHLEASFISGSKGVIQQTLLKTFKLHLSGHNKILKNLTQLSSDNPDEMKGLGLYVYSRLNPRFNMKTNSDHKIGLPEGDIIKKHPDFATISKYDYHVLEKGLGEKLFSQVSEHISKDQQKQIKVQTNMIDKYTAEIFSEVDEFKAKMKDLKEETKNAIAQKEKLEKAKDDANDAIEKIKNEDEELNKIKDTISIEIKDYIKSQNEKIKEILKDKDKNENKDETIQELHQLKQKAKNVIDSIIKNNKNVVEEINLDEDSKKEDHQSYDEFIKSLKENTIRPFYKNINHHVKTLKDGPQIHESSKKLIDKEKKSLKKDIEKIEEEFLAKVKEIDENDSIKKQAYEFKKLREESENEIKSRFNKTTNKLKKEYPSLYDDELKEELSKDLSEDIKNLNSKIELEEKKLLNEEKKRMEEGKKTIEEESNKILDSIDGIKTKIVLKNRIKEYTSNIEKLIDAEENKTIKNIYYKHYNKAHAKIVKAENEKMKELNERNKKVINKIKKNFTYEEPDENEKDTTLNDISDIEKEFEEESA